MPPANPHHAHAAPAARRLPIVGVALGAAITLGLVAPATADQTVREARRSREEARAAQAQAAAQIDVLTAQDHDVARGLTAIELAVASQRAVVTDAARALADAEAAAADRRRSLLETEAAIERARQRVIDLAVASYVGRTFDDSVTVVLDSGDATHAVRRAALLDLVHGNRRDAIDALRDREVQHGEELVRADNAVGAADARRAELATALAELEVRLDSQNALRTALQQRIASWQHEQNQMAAEEAALTELIGRRQRAALGTALSARARDGFVMPAAGPIGSKFGPRFHPIFRVTRRHAGIDMAGRTGDPVVAAKSGTVLFAGVRGGYGNAIVVEHEGGVSTVYAHLSAIDTRPGAEVATGQRIGRIGSTGLSTGPHLHFEVRVTGVAKDPELFLP